MRLSNIDVVQFLKDTRTAVTEGLPVTICNKPVGAVYLRIGVADYCFYGPGSQNLKYMDSLILRVSRFPLQYLEDEKLTKVKYNHINKSVTISILESYVSNESRKIGPVAAT